jgi:hypothetical protein
MPPGDLPSWVPRWCRQHLGHEPVEVLFSLDQMSTVVGLRLADGKHVVVKAREDDGRAGSCVAAGGLPAVLAALVERRGAAGRLGRQRVVCRPSRPLGSTHEQQNPGLRQRAASPDRGTASSRGRRPRSGVNGSGRRLLGVLRGGCDGLGDLRRDGRVDQSWRRRSCSRRSALGVMVRPRQLRLARSSSG